MLDATKLVGLLAEPERRQVVAAMILGAGDLGSIVSASGLDQRSATKAIDRLLEAGLVDVGSDGHFVLLEEAFKLAARSGGHATAEPDADGSSDGPVDESARIIQRSIVDGRLVQLPRKRSRRLVVLDHLAQRFEPGVHYSEREVNRILVAFDEDVAALRRYLVDERFLDREDGVYWRSGGTVDLSPEG